MAVCPSCFRQQGVKKLSPRDPDPTCAHCGTPLVLEESELPHQHAPSAGDIAPDLPRAKRPASHPGGSSQQLAAAPPAQHAPLELSVPSTNFAPLPELDASQAQPLEPAFQFALGTPPAGEAPSFPATSAPPPAPSEAPRDTAPERRTVAVAPAQSSTPAAVEAEAVPVVSRRKVYKQSREVPMAPAAERPAPRPALKLEISGGVPAAESSETNEAAGVAPLIAEPKPVTPVVRNAPRTAYRKELRSRRKLAILIGSSAVAVIGLVVTAMQLPALRGDADPAKVLEPMARELSRDSYQAYRKAADLMLGQAGHRSVRLKCSAAKLLGASVLFHGGGDTARLDEAEKLLRDLDVGSHPPLDFELAQGYIALARGNLAAAPKMTGPSLDLPEAQLYEGWRLMVADGKPLQGWRSFQSAVDQEAKAAGMGNAPQPGAAVGLLAKYGIARAREMARQRDAQARYEKVLKLNKEHFGAQLGVLRRVALAPGELMDKVNALVDKHGQTAGPGELAEAYALLGRVLRSEGRTTESDSALNRATALAPTALWATLSVAETLVFDGRGQDAVSRLRPLGAAGTKTLDGKLAMSGALLLSNEATNSFSLLRLAALEQSRDPRVLYWQGRHAEQGSDPEAAKEFYKQSLTMDPRFLPAALQMASVLVRQGKGQEALTVLKQAESADNPPASLQLELGQTLLATRHFAQAREAFDAALGGNPDLIAARLGIVATYEHAGEFQAAYDALQKLLGEKPDAPGAREQLADVLYRLNRKDEALALYQKLLTGDKVASSVKVGAARIYLDRNDPAAAAPLIEPVAKRDATEPGAAICMARLLWQQEKIPVALSEFKHAMTVDNSPEAHWHYARALQVAGKDDEALLQYQQADGYPDALAERGRILLKVGQVDQALAELERAIKSTGVEPDAWLLLGNAYEKLGQREKAVAAWRTCIGLGQNTPEAYYRLGRVEMESDRSGSALDHLRRAVVSPADSAPWMADAYFQLGYAERAKGSRSAAARAFEEFLRLAPRNAPTRTEVQRVLAELK